MCFSPSKGWPAIWDSSGHSPSGNVHPDEPGVELSHSTCGSLSKRHRFLSDFDSRVVIIDSNGQVTSAMRKMIVARFNDRVDRSTETDVISSPVNFGFAFPLERRLLFFFKYPRPTLFVRSKNARKSLFSYFYILLKVSVNVILVFSRESLVGTPDLGRRCSTRTVRQGRW